VDSTLLMALMAERRQLNEQLRTITEPALRAAYLKRIAEVEHLISRLETR
jgi:hypothetical protein